ARAGGCGWAARGGPPPRQRRPPRAGPPPGAPACAAASSRSTRRSRSSGTSALCRSGRSMRISVTPSAASTAIMPRPARRTRSSLVDCLPGAGAWQAHAHGCTDPQLARDVDGAAVLLDDLPRDGQTQPGARHALRDIARAIEALKHAREILERDAAAGVTHHELGKLDAIVRQPGLDADVDRCARRAVLHS